MGGRIANVGCDWEPIDGFSSLAEYQRFQAWMKEQISSGLAVLISVSEPYSGSSLWEESWYQCLDNDQIWRLVGPEPPFRGLFKRVR